MNSYIFDDWDDDGFEDENAIKSGFSPNFIVVRRQLVQKLLHPVLLPHRVHIRHLVVREGGEEQMHLGHRSF